MIEAYKEEAVYGLFSSFTRWNGGPHGEFGKWSRTRTGNLENLDSPLLTKPSDFLLGTVKKHYNT